MRIKITLESIREHLEGKHYHIAVQTYIEDTYLQFTSFFLTKTREKVYNSFVF